MLIRKLEYSRFNLLRHTMRACVCVFVPKSILNPEARASLGFLFLSNCLASSGQYF